LLVTFVKGFKKAIMSEYFNNNRDRLNRLTGFARSLVGGEDGRELIQMYKDEIAGVTPFETMYVLDKLLLEGIEIEKVKEYTGKIINVFFKSLQGYSWQKPAEGHFIYYLMLENREAEKIINDLRVVIKKLYHDRNSQKTSLLKDLKLHLNRLKEYELHYIKKENILFPFIEKAFPNYRCLQLMWSFHDDFRRSIRDLDTLLENQSPDREKLSRVLGKLFFVVLPIIFREEQIVFPVAIEVLHEKAWIEMMHQSHETGWFKINIPAPLKSTRDLSVSGNFIDLKSGLLNPEQIILLLNNLPVDITYVDENDEVRYFSSGKHRIFPRSNAIIGRKVQNCHPPASVHIVNDIIESFRKGVKDQAEFWINRKGSFIHIRYFVLRNEHQEYKGVIEVSQDVTSLRALEGERRLLDW
jgi:uncharacterized protein